MSKKYLKIFAVATLASMMTTIATPAFAANADFYDNTTHQSYYATNYRSSAAAFNALIIALESPQSNFVFENGAKWYDYDKMLIALQSSTKPIAEAFTDAKADPANAGTVAKANGPALAGVTIDDTANTLSGMTSAMEISTNGTAWTTYNEVVPNLPDLTGTVALQVRVAATVTHKAGAVATFNFNSTQVGTAPVNLGTAGNYAILAKSGISSVPNSVITGNIGVSPASATYITGFSLSEDAPNGFSTSTQITGKAYASDYASTTSSDLTTAVSNMEAAYTDASGRAVNFTELYSGDISGSTLTTGVYKWGTDVLINTDVTLTGGANDVFIFQVAKGITQANGTRITLSGGVQAKNIFWQAAETVKIGTTAHFEGVILGQKNITLGTGASINGRLLAQTAVTLDQSTVVAP